MKRHYVYIVRDRNFNLRVKRIDNRDKQNTDPDSAGNSDHSADLRGEIIWSAAFETIEEAFSLEKQLKGWSRAKKLALAAGDFSLLKILAQCRNSTHHKYKPDPSAPLGALTQ